MQTRPDAKATDNPADIAREAFRMLAKRRIVPTPEAYRVAYDEVAGVARRSDAESVLAGFAASLIPGDEAAGPMSKIGQRMTDAIRERDWETCGHQLDVLLASHRDALAAKALASAAPLSSPAASAAAGTTSPATAAEKQANHLRDLLGRTLSLAVTSLLQGVPDLAEEADQTGRMIRNAFSDAALDAAASRLKQLCFSIELRSGDMAEQQELLLRLFRLLLENVGKLLDDDAWMRGQIGMVQSLLEGPIDHRMLEEAARNLKEVIYKQGILKEDMAAAKSTVKKMMLTFIDQLGSVATTTGDFHASIDRYAQQIRQASDIGALNEVLEKLLQESRIMQREALLSRDNFLEVRRDATDTDTRIRSLEAELAQMSELVRLDQLTGSLNRRGLDDMLERELARAARRSLPLCLAMLDLDDFKRINDSHGHAAGDDALIHLVRVIRDTLRTMDVIGRFGGEEFMIILPETGLDDARRIVTRLQRELTERIFMHRHERLFITFSAGVVLYVSGEDSAALIQRADGALYKAKRAGKNRVCTDKD